MMRVESGRNHHAPGLHDFGVCLLGSASQFTGRLNGSHTAVFQQQVTARIHSGGRIDDVATGNQDGSQARPLFLGVVALGLGLSAGRRDLGGCSGARAR